MNSSLQFEFKLYMIFFSLCFILSLISGVANAIINVTLWGILFQFTFVALYFAYFFIPLKIKQKLFKPLLLLSTLIYLPIMFFPTSGTTGTCLLFVTTGIFMNSIVFKGRSRIGIIGINIVIYLAFILLEYNFPKLVTPFVDEQSRLVDFIVASIMAFTGFGFIAIYVSDAFHNEQKHIISLMKELEQKNETLANLSVRDALTGAYNRRYLADYVEYALKECAANNTNIVVMMLDLDYFKKVNDIYGHTAGDEVLVRFTDIVNSCLRSDDVLARYGGEEFVVLMKDIPPKLALQTANRISDSVQKLEFVSGLKITVSIGIVQSESGDTYEALLDRADVLMYKAKKAGRNKVMCESVFE